MSKPMAVGGYPSNYNCVEMRHCSWQNMADLDCGKLAGAGAAAVERVAAGNGVFGFGINDLGE